MISRLVTGIVFLFSGFVKAVDPKGGAIKIGEYLEVAGLHPSDGLTIGLSILLSAAEFIIGFHLLFGLKIKSVATPALLFMSFFTILTLYIAIDEPVSDCGCFGDAVKLSNWETFFKNLIIIPFSFYIYKQKDKMESGLTSIRQHLLTTLSIVFIVGISIYCVKYLPIIDFRPYHIGANITESMSIPDDAEQDEYETTFILEKDGVRKEFDMNNYPYNDSTWVFVENKTITIKEGYQPPIQGLAFESTDGNDLTNTIIDNTDLVFLVVAPKLEKASKKHIKDLIELKDFCYKNGHQFYVATSSLTDECYKFDVENQAGFEYALCDETTLKTIIRSNPGLVVIQKGTIIGKYNHTNLPKIKDLNYAHASILRSQQKSWNNASLWAIFLALGSIIILIHKSK